ncbi:hypothetical protein [Streptomyces antibioticus]|uniref:hypothetical protein n=1 Tax=Streptomyces antibioticus TaxID=1890 RepID=UPI003F471611
MLIAAGSGITPMMSMIRTQPVAGGGGPVALLYSSRARQEVIFGDELDRPAAAHRGRLTVTHVLTAGEGRLDEAKIRTWASGFTTDGLRPLLRVRARAVDGRGRQGAAPPGRP